MIIWRMRAVTMGKVLVRPLNRTAANNYPTTIGWSPTNKFNEQCSLFQRTCALRHTYRYLTSRRMWAWRFEPFPALNLSCCNDVLFAELIELTGKFGDVGREWRRHRRCRWGPRRFTVDTVGASRLLAACNTWLSLNPTGGYSVRTADVQI